MKSYRNWPVIAKLENCASLGVVLVAEGEAGLWELEVDRIGVGLTGELGAPSPVQGCLQKGCKIQLNDCPFCGYCVNIVTVGANVNVLISGQETPKWLPRFLGAEGGWH